MELYSAAVGKGWGSCSSEGAGQAEERAASKIEVWVPLDHGHQILEKDDMIYKCHTRHSIYRSHPVQLTLRCTSQGICKFACLLSHM